jgi:L-amino acid N-acyltransferase YncA
LHPARHVELDQICVDNNFRGQGIGKALVAAMAAWMAQTNFREWNSMVHGFNTHSQNLMLVQGAEVLGMRYHKTLG